MTEAWKRNNLMREGVGEEERLRRWWRNKRRSESEARGMREERSWWGGRRSLRVKGRGTGGEGGEGGGGHVVKGDDLGVAA